MTKPDGVQFIYIETLMENLLRGTQINIASYVKTDDLSISWHASRLYAYTETSAYKN